MSADDMVLHRGGEDGYPERERAPLPEPTVPDTVKYVERTATIGLAFILVFSAAFVIAAANTTSTALQELRRENARNSAYQEARYDVAMEEVFARKERTAATRAGERAVHAALAAAVRTIDNDSGPADRARDAEMLQAHRDRDRANAFARIEKRVSARAARQRAVTDQTIARLRRLQQFVVSIALVLAVLRVICFGVYIAIVFMYKRRLADTHRAQVTRLQEAAGVDHLTGIGNHRAFKDVFARAAARAAHSGEWLTLALLDIDEMKLINDRSGHLHGDWVLRNFGRLLRAISPRAQSFRLGGDEFALLLANLSPEAARGVVDRLRASAENTLAGATISVGAASLTGPQCDENVLQTRADAALYAAKRGGRNRLVVFDSTVDEQWMLSPAKVRALRSLIGGDEMRIAFQPIWDMATDSILAYEALARPQWASPQEVFDLAERVGRAHELDAVCRRAALRRAGELPDGALLFLNVSPRSLDRGLLDPRQFAADVTAAGLSPARVAVELTERSSVPVDVSARAGEELQRLGFRLALDNTGSGGAGLELLGRLCFDFVKIDRSIVVKAMAERSARAVLAGVIAIAKETGACVIAEGIEDLRMLDFICARSWSELTRSGAQGFLLGRPSPTIAPGAGDDDVRAMLRRSRAAGLAALAAQAVNPVLVRTVSPDRPTPAGALE